MEKQTNQRTIRICSSCSHCPMLTIGKEEIILKDDFGGMVRLTTAEFAQLKEIMKQEKI